MQHERIYKYIYIQTRTYGNGVVGLSPRYRACFFLFFLSFFCFFFLASLPERPGNESVLDEDSAHGTGLALENITPVTEQMVVFLSPSPPCLRPLPAYKTVFCFSPDLFSFSKLYTHIHTRVSMCICVALSIWGFEYIFRGSRFLPSFSIEANRRGVPVLRLLQYLSPRICHECITAGMQHPPEDRVSALGKCIFFHWHLLARYRKK